MVVYEVSQGQVALRTPPIEHIIPTSGNPPRQN